MFKSLLKISNRRVFDNIFRVKITIVIIEKNAIEKFVKNIFIKVHPCLGLNILNTSVKQDFMKGLNS